MCNAWNHPPHCNCGWGGEDYFGAYGGGGGGYSSFRSTSDGQIFEFPFTTYPSYITPNAVCPICAASVYFYQSPYGGRVFFDELGPPWPKHPCTNTPLVRHHFSSVESRACFLVGAPTQRSESDSETGAALAPVAAPPGLAPWAEAGWMPFVVTRIVPGPIGIEVEGKLFVSPGSESVAFRIVQASADARFYRTQGRLQIGFSLVQNASPVLSALGECPVLLKKDPDLEHLTLSSFILTRDGEIQEITLSVVGVEGSNLTQ